MKGDMGTLQSVMIFVSLCCAQSFSKKQRVHKESVSKQGRKFAKGESSVQRDPLFDEIPEDTVDHIETENAQDVGGQEKWVDEDKGDDERYLVVMIPRPTSYKITSDIKPLPKKLIQRQGKKKIEEEEESYEVNLMGFLKQGLRRRLLAEEAFKNTEREQFTIEERRQFEEIQVLYEKIKRSDEDFISIGSAEDERLIKRMNEKGVDSSKGEVIKEEIKKKPRKRIKEKKVSERENLADKVEHFEEINQNIMIRSNGQKRYFSTLMRVLSIFDREDLNAVYQLVMDRFQDEIPEGFDRVLWGDLMVMFNPDDENDYSYVVEKKYPLKKEVLVQMLKLKLESEEDSTMALELIRFIKKFLARLNLKNMTVVEMRRVLSVG
ncbi:hypothetical protein Tco_0349748 [Tanacetum coccineum]